MSARGGIAFVMLGAPLLADLAVKKLVQHNLDYAQPSTIFPGLNLTLLYNPGVSFGLFPVGSSTGLNFMVALQSILCLGIAVYAWNVRSKQLVWPLLLLLSGALGNLIDRFINGAVTDYLDLYVDRFHWPAFNLADIWITLGVAGFIAFEYAFKSSASSVLNSEGHS